MPGNLRNGSPASRRDSPAAFSVLSPSNRFPWYQHNMAEHVERLITWFLSLHLVNNYKRNFKQKCARCERYFYLHVEKIHLKFLFEAYNVKINICKRKS